MIQIELRRIAEELLGQVVGISRGGIGFTRPHGTAGRDVDGGLRDPG
jgi:hypothetical protein